MQEERDFGEDAPKPAIQSTVVPPRRKGGRPRKDARVARAAPHAGSPMSSEQIAELAAKMAAQVVGPALDRVMDRIAALEANPPRRIVPPPRVGASPAPAAETEDENFDPLAADVQRAARARLNGNGHAPIPRAQGLSDEEVLAMFQGEELGEFDVPREMIPDGVVYGWKLKEVLGKPNPGYESELRQRQWTAVRHEDHPGAFGGEDESGPIIRKGLMLMRRPAEMEELRQRYYRLLAKQAVRDKVAQMGQAPAGTGPRTHPKVRPDIKRTYEPLPVE